MARRQQGIAYVRKSGFTEFRTKPHFSPVNYLVCMLIMEQADRQDR